MRLIVRGYCTCLMLAMLAPLSLDAQQIIFSEDFEQGNFGAAWKLNTGQPNGVIEVFPTSGLQGAYAARLGKSKDEEALTLNRLDLALDLSGYSQLMLQLMVLHNHEEVHVQDGIYLSADGGNSFEKVYDFNFAEWPAQAGMLPPINLSMLAARHGIRLGAGTIIRFQQYGSKDFTGGADFSDGLYIDAITLTENNIPFAQLPFEEDFSSGELSAPWMKGDPMLSDSSGNITPSGLIEISNEGGENGNVLKMGSRFDKKPATNAVDLRLNLSGMEHVRLSFDIYDNRDETHPADGIFFSDNGGRSFTKVFTFDFDQWQDDFFGTISALDVNRMAAQQGLRLNEQFVIRFQQHDDDDFNGTRLSSDGMMLDNIKVYNASPVYASLPLEENFESQKLAPYWQISDPRSSEFYGEISNNGKIDIVSPDEDGNHVVRLGNQRDKSYATNALDLYLKLAAHPEALLSFRYYDHFDETHKEDGIFFSNDGGKSFKKVFSFDGDEYSDKQMGEFRALSIRRLAQQRNISLTDQFVIRFQQYDDDDFNGTRTISDGYYLDDIKIFEAQPVYATVPFREEFSQDSLSKHWAFGDLGSSANDKHIRPCGIVALSASLGNEENAALIMGRSKDGHQTTNAADLHVNLEGAYDLMLNFHLLNMQTQSSEENGIWFSNNGGASFKKIWHLQAQGDNFMAYSFSLDSLVGKAGLSFSKNSVIRFQQSDSKKFDRNSSIKGGIGLDNISLAKALPIPVLSWPVVENRAPDCSEYEFTWTPSRLATAYQLQVYTHINGKEEIIRDTVVQNDFYKVNQLPKDSSYFCRVKMMNEFVEGKWSKPLVFRTFETFEVNVQIRGVIDEEKGVLLQASHLPTHEYQWFRNGEPLSDQKNHLFSATEPGKYTVFISNKDCGVMSPPVVLEAKAFGFMTVGDKNSVERGGR